jgi:hypothetical protein
MSREDDFNRITKGVPVHALERAFGYLTRGIDWRGTGRPAMRKCYSDGKPLYAKDGLTITPEQLESAITAERSGDRDQILSVIDQRNSAQGVSNV